MIVPEEFLFNRRRARSRKWLVHCPRLRFGLVFVCRSMANLICQSLDE